MPEFQSFIVFFLHHFVFAKLATSSLWAMNLKDYTHTICDRKGLQVWRPLSSHGLFSSFFCRVVSIEGVVCDGCQFCSDRWKER